MYARIHVFTYTHIHINTSAHIHVNTYTCKHILTYIRHKGAKAVLLDLSILFTTTTPTANLGKSSRGRGSAREDVPLSPSRAAAAVDQDLHGTAVPYSIVRQNQQQHHHDHYQHRIMTFTLHCLWPNCHPQYHRHRHHHHHRHRHHRHHQPHLMPSHRFPPLHREDHS